MAAKYHMVRTVVWDDTRWHTDDPMNVVEGDWRDPSLEVNVEGARMVSGDEHWRGREAGTAVEPDWNKGSWLEGPGPTQPKLMEFGGYPGKLFADALLKGLVLRGSIVAEDQ